MYLLAPLLIFPFREESEIIEGEVVEIVIDRPASGTVSCFFLHPVASLSCGICCYTSKYYSSSFFVFLATVSVGLPSQAHAEKAALMRLFEVIWSSCIAFARAFPMMCRPCAGSLSDCSFQLLTAKLLFVSFFLSLLSGRKNWQADTEDDRDGDGIRLGYEDD